MMIGGNFRVLSTGIYFAVVGAAQDQGQAAVLAIVLLGFTPDAPSCCSALWTGRRSYVTVTGKGDGGIPAPLPRGAARRCASRAVLPWLVLTAAVLRHHPGRRLRQGDRHRQHADAATIS